MIYRELPKEGLPVTQASDIRTSQDIVLNADVVVVGSGTGGAIIAHELAAAGKSVIILEAGRYVPSNKFTEDMAWALENLYQDVGAQTNTIGDTIVMQGNCVGGSSVISATIAVRAPDYVLESWAKDHGVEGLAPNKIAPYYEKVERRLHVHLNEPHEINDCANAIIRGCEALGWSWRPQSRNVKQCALTGHCLAGCPSDRKTSMQVTYLAWAVAAGVKIYADTYVEQILIQNGRAVGVSGRMIDPDNQATVANIKVNAQIVVSAAGAIHTPLLLQRSKLPNKNDQLGRNLSLHPTSVVLGKFPVPVYGWRGAFAGMHIDEFLGEEDGKMLMESGLAAPVQLMAQNELSMGVDHIRFMQEFKYFSALNILLPDTGHGYVHWSGPIRGGSKRIEWNMTKPEFALFKDGLKRAGRIFFAAGAERVYLPTYQRIQATSLEELDQIVDSIDYGALGLFAMRLVSVNAQGSCRMGADRKKAVIDPYGQSYEVSGLFVSDASLLPSIAVQHPMLTVAALAHYIADKIIKDYKGYFWS
ncbi:GMC family oxidoreductase [Agitococcus lubricus]|uniref:Choline dehydrogenase-like flavoprotein n=1 Tax=Agitococcus lubricus TaxID=1077255 RepID=A0A2T5IWK2_9GAMM|nr:GMC family oxidoreductase [Agitococcus lubricus]PTQ88274.1 choline dehydrogenase-like flavoprotein [Agitococcus lubricus]